MIPLIMAGIGTGMQLWGGIQNKNEEERAKKRALEANSKEIDFLKGRQAETNTLQRGSNTDLATAYLTAREARKAEGIANMYLSGMQSYRQQMAGIDNQIASSMSDRSKIAGTKTSGWGDVLLGTVPALANVGMAASGMMDSNLAAQKDNLKQEAFGNIMSGKDFDFTGYAGKMKQLDATPWYNKLKNKWN